VARAAGSGGLWLGGLQLAPTIVLLAAVAAAIDAGLAGWGPGERVATAVAVAVHDELAARPPRSLAPALLLYGAARPRLEAAVVLEIRPGTGVTARDPAVARATEALGLPPPRRGGRRGRVLIGAAGGEAAVDLALAVADALDQAGGMALRFAGHSRRLDA
jgi:hypothetical protein